MLSKRTTLIQNISHMAIVSAINIIFVLLANFIPILSILLVLILPLLSAVTIIYCEKKYFPIYAVATIGLCLLVSINNIGDVLFYVLPSIITGAIFGLFIEKEINSLWSISTATIAQFALTISINPLIKLITGINFIDLISKFMDGSIFILLISFAQIILSYFVIKEEIKKLGVEVNFKLDHKDISIVLFVIIILTLLQIPFAFIYISISYVLMVLAMVYCLIFIVYFMFKKATWIYIFTPVSFIVSIILFALLFPLIDIKYGLLLINLYFIIPLIPSIIYFLKINVSSKI